MHRSLNLLFKSLQTAVVSAGDFWYPGLSPNSAEICVIAWFVSYVFEVSSQPTHNSTRVFQIKLLYFKDSLPPPPPTLQSRLFNLIYASGAHNSGSATFQWCPKIYLTFKICWKMDLEINWSVVLGTIELASPGLRASWCIKFIIPAPPPPPPTNLFDVRWGVTFVRGSCF